jgi:hypothetical protein
MVFAFSGGGVLLGPLLDADPPWLRGVGLTYAMCAHTAESSSTFTTPIQADTSTPILLTRAEYEERAWLIESNDALAATHDVDIIEVAAAQHGFETTDDTDAARAAIRQTIAWAAERLGLSADSRAGSR